VGELPAVDAIAGGDDSCSVRGCHGMAKRPSLMDLQALQDLRDAVGSPSLNGPSVCACCGR
jgi:hypothetical protein